MQVNTIAQTKTTGLSAGFSANLAGMSRAGVLGAVLALGLGLAPAEAGTRLKERVYDDSFGNLVILSPSGYKRIVVGMGHVALELEAQENALRAAPAHCWQPPVLWKGRAHMYGLADGEIPAPPVLCR